ncbi:hypothetical protein PR202_gb24768 [Eleusine coracana subsp. coracana]|uniref:PHD finger protein ALFIN-LIKE n=1 Tax=Eleusine coracana subsp. coracana TaxID=191504 RepID=A0AAV5FNA0_ELECO|nr:hypothetical protein PR202_gb24768 [Eleusine coracana subsp. coracana]
MACTDADVASQGGQPEVRVKHGNLHQSDLVRLPMATASEGAPSTVCDVRPYMDSPTKRLFGMMNDLPTVFEVVSGGAKQSRERDRSGNDNSGRNKLSAKHTSEARIENNVREADEGYDEDDGDHSETLCGTCGGIYSADEFWIGCDVCEKWYHGKCVKITPAKAESIKQYKCPSCSSKRPRP